MHTHSRLNEFVSGWNGMHRVHGLSGICPEAIDTDDDRTHTQYTHIHHTRTV